MVQPQLDPWLAAVTYSLAMASLVTWLALLVRRTERPFLRYEARQPVPWGPVATLLAVFFVVMPIVGELTGATSPARAALDHPARQIAAYIFQQALVTGVFVAAIAFFSGAAAGDLGLPAGARQWGRGVMIGLIGWLAALLPVQGMQALLFSWFHTQSQHPLVQLVIEKPSPSLMAVAFVAAVVVAPTCEEIIFRLLLQGWLEKWEDLQLGWRAAAQPTAVAVPDAGIAGPAAPAEGTPGQDGRAVSAGADATEQVPALPAPPRHGLAGLPYGWVPIIISSEMFGLAHFGHGTDPIPLVLLGIILGYIYQRTHKITACIVTHTAFNLLSMLVLWRAIETHAM
jgi:membrane protease YdiL (CAAX protease family)